MQIYDDVIGNGIPDGVPAVIIYIDGPESEWTAANIARFASTPSVACTVLANDQAPMFDWEKGDAPANEVAAAIARRFARGQWSVIYLEKVSLPDVVALCATAGVPLLNGSQWPQVGAYLHIADPDSGVEHTTVPGSPVQPLAVQWLWTANYDISTSVNTYPAPPPPPAPGGQPANPQPVKGNGPVPTFLKIVPSPIKGFYLFWSDGTVNAMAGAPFYNSYEGLPAAEREAPANFIDAIVLADGTYAMVNSGVQPGGAGVYHFTTAP